MWVMLRSQDANAIIKWLINIHSVFISFLSFTIHWYTQKGGNLSINVLIIAKSLFFLLLFFTHKGLSKGKNYNLVVSTKKTLTLTLTLSPNSNSKTVHIFKVTLVSIMSMRANPNTQYSRYSMIVPKYNMPTIQLCL